MDFTMTRAECERGISKCTQEILDCDKKIHGIPILMNNMLTIGKARMRQSKEFEEEAERLRSESGRFCLRGMMGREIYGNNSQEHNDLLNEAEKSASIAMNNETHAKAYEKCAKLYETNSKEMEKFIDEFRRIKSGLQSEKERLEKTLQEM